MTSSVAEPLTEEEATAELSAQREEEERKAHDKERSADARRAKAEARRSRRAEKKEARQSAKKTPGSFTAQDFLRPIIDFSGGRLLLTLNTTSCIVMAAGFCVLVLGAYSLGRNLATQKTSSNFPTAAALTHTRPSAGEQGGSQAGLEDPSRSSVEPVQRQSGGPDFSAFLKPPASRQSMAQANHPARVSSDLPARTADGQRLNYLQIESFLISRDISSEELKVELDDVRRFLSERDVSTFARRLPNGFALFGAQGFPPSRDFRARRETFRKKIEDLGQAYRRAGGLYEFKGCFYVNYERAAAGQSIRS